MIRDIVSLLANALYERKLYRRISVPATSCEQLNYIVGQELTQYWREGRELLQNIDVVCAFNHHPNKYSILQNSLKFSPTERQSIRHHRSNSFRSIL